MTAPRTCVSNLAHAIPNMLENDSTIHIYNMPYHTCSKFSSLYFCVKNNLAEKYFLFLHHWLVNICWDIYMSGSSQIQEDPDPLVWNAPFCFVVTTYTSISGIDPIECKVATSVEEVSSYSKNPTVHTAMSLPSVVETIVSTFPKLV